MTARRARDDEHLGGAVPAAPSGVPRVSELLEDRLEALAVAECERYGYRLSVRCTECRHWVSNPKSVALHLGPRCRAKLRAAQEQEGGGR